MIFKKVPLEVSLLNYFEEAHNALVMAAKIAHLEKHPEAENISKLIDVLEDQIEKILPAARQARERVE